MLRAIKQTQVSVKRVRSSIEDELAHSTALTTKVRLLFQFRKAVLVHPVIDCLNQSPVAPLERSTERWCK